MIYIASTIDIGIGIYVLMLLLLLFLMSLYEMKVMFIWCLQYSRFDDNRL